VRGARRGRTAQGGLQVRLVRRRGSTRIGHRDGSRPIARPAASRTRDRSAALSRTASQGGTAKRDPLAASGLTALLDRSRGREALEKLVLHATNLRIPIVEVEGGTLTALAGFDGHQGIGLVVPPRRYATPEEILARAADRGEAPFVLALDSLEDPQNVGSLLRTAEAAGVHGAIFPMHRQAPLTPAAVKASAGAVEHLLLASVPDLASALADMHVRGLRVVGSDADAPLGVRDADLRGPLVLVVGSEGQGLGPAVRRRSDL